MVKSPLALLYKKDSGQAGMADITLTPPSPLEGEGEDKEGNKTDYFLNGFTIISVAESQSRWLCLLVLS